MRQSSLASLLPGTQRRILDLVVLQPDSAWYRSELARTLGVPPSSLQRPLAALVAAGVMEIRQDGNRVYYHVNRHSPTYAELRGLIIKSSGLVHVLQDALRPHGKSIELAFVYGSFARGEETAASDVDLAIVGTVGLAALSLPLRMVRDRLGREINATVYSPAEFAKKAHDRKHFLARVLEGRTLMVIGTEDDLGRATRSAARRARADQ